MSFNPNIDYFISFDGSDNTTKVKIDLSEIENIGLEECLRAKVNFVFYSFEIKYRKIYMTDYKSHLEKRERKYERQEYSTRKNYNRQQVSEEIDKLYRVHLSDIDLSYPPFVDVMAINEHKAIVRALHSINVFQFPNGWKHAHVSQLKN